MACSSRSYAGNLPSSFSTLLSSAWYSLPVHLCRFQVRSKWGLFPGTPSLPGNPISSNNLQHPSTPHWPTNINVVPIDYGFRPRLRGRLTLRRLALQEPLDFRRECFSHSSRYSCLHSHFRYLQAPSRVALQELTERSATATERMMHPKLRCTALAPIHFQRRNPLFRPVSCYAFFKGWLLLSQPPGCFGIPTSFPT